MTEQGAFLDGLDTNDQRRAGTGAFLDGLGNFLGCPVEFAATRSTYG